MIFRDYSTTGDGLVGALQILRIMRATGQPLGKLKKCLHKYPQAQRNLKVTTKPPLDELPRVTKLVAETEEELAGKGRVLLRYSGTEPKIRLLIEGATATPPTPPPPARGGPPPQRRWDAAPPPPAPREFLPNSPSLPRALPPQNSLRGE